MIKSFWLDVALRLVHTALGLIVDHRAGRLNPQSDSKAAPELQPTGAPVLGI